MTMHQGTRAVSQSFLGPAMVWLALVVCPPPVGAQDGPDVGREEINAAVARVKPALVRIHVVIVDERQGREVKREGAGSGTIITKDGHIVTNHHVVGKASRIVCTLATKEEIEADLVGTDPLSDVSVIKLRSVPGAVFPAATFGDSSLLTVGQRVLAMGSPFALSQSVTLGIISNTEMVMPKLFWPFDRFTLEGEDVGSVVRWIGHDAPIFGGNSGGPLVNLRGEIVGVNEISMGLGGAIPSNLAKEVAERLITEGRVVRSWIGLEVQPLLKSGGHKKGALIAGTIEGSIADRAGFQPGDILVRFAGQDVNVRFAEELPLFNHLLMRLPIGSDVEAVVLRDGKQRALRVKTTERENMEAKVEEVKAWGISASNLTMWTAKEAKRANRDGVQVRGIRPGGPADEAKPSITDKDIIFQVDGATVKSLADLQTLTKKILQGKTQKTPVVVGFERNAERYLTVVQLGPQPIDDPTLQARKAWLPVAVQVLTSELAERLGVSGRTGVRVTQVYQSSASEKAGLRVSDLIVAVDGEKIPASQPEDVEVLPTMIRQYRIGTVVELTVIRNSVESRLKVELGQSPKLAREMKKYRADDFEFIVRDVAFTDKGELHWSDAEGGVLVEAVSEGGWAAIGHLAERDLILSVNGERVADVTAFENIMKKIAKAQAKSVVLLVRRGIRSVFIELEPSWGRE